MPDYLPAHRELVYASGVAEMAGGAGVLSERTRKPAGWWLIATLIAVFPANLNMALHPDRYARIPPAALWARLPFQARLHPLGLARRDRRPLSCGARQARGRGGAAGHPAGARLGLRPAGAGLGQRPRPRRPSRASRSALPRSSTTWAWRTTTCDPDLDPETGLPAVVHGDAARAPSRGLEAGAAEDARPGSLRRAARLASWDGALRAPRAEPAGARLHRRAARASSASSRPRSGCPRTSWRRNQRLIWIFDSLSLALLLGWDPFEVEGIERRGSTIDPWPFREDSLTLRCDARRLVRGAPLHEPRPGRRSRSAFSGPIATQGDHSPSASERSTSRRVRGPMIWFEASGADSRSVPAAVM